MPDLERLRLRCRGVLVARSGLADRRRIAHETPAWTAHGKARWTPSVHGSQLCARRRSRFVTSRRAAVRPSNAHALGVNASSAPRSPIGTSRSVNILDVAHRLTTSSSRQPATLPHRAGAQKPHRSCPSDARPSTTGLAGERALRREQSSGHHRASRRRRHATSAGACARERRDESCNARLSRQASDSVPMSRRGQPSAPRTGVHLCDLFRPFAFGQQIDEPSPSRVPSRVTCCRRLLWRSPDAHIERDADRWRAGRRRRVDVAPIAPQSPLTLAPAPAGADGRLNCALRSRSQDAAPAA